MVEEEQAGASRAEYGQRVINDLAEKLSVEFGRGFDARELRHYRQFYLLFPKWDALRPELTWTHYRTLIRVENERARLYYMNEAALQNWSTRALDSQIERLTYERILSSQNQLIVKEAEDAASRQAQITPADIIKDPYVLDFLGLPSGVNFYEKDLEKALIDNLQQFLLELGRGFSFVSRQYRFKTDNENYYVDLVFYNFILKCFVLIDLKVGKLTYQDIGQMDFYTRYFEENIRTETDNPTIGIVLCTERDNTIVKYSVMNDSNQLFASKYKLYLPTEEELIKELETSRKQIENNVK
ncbi:YhcG family protein [Alistipes sp.]|uniref:PDDEXK nuclease domain-containing protein n=1 Tax=Alistipes sp. TaxID=1872444 RepID=UPI0023F2DD1A|nr:PDDEXK nuclease domain-containing protein [Alistipes sp.]